MDDIDGDTIIILRCCRDWPIQAKMAMMKGGSCGLCGEYPTVVFERYVAPERDS